MENDLVSIYENNYLQGSIVEEKSAGKADINKNGKIEGWEAARDKAIKKSMGHEGSEKEDEDEDETHEEAVKRKLKKKSMKAKKAKKPVDAGEIYGDSFQRSENIFDKILREMDEMGGEYDSSSEESDNVFGASDTSSDEEEQTFTLSELRNMTLGELVSMLGGEDEGEEDYSFEDESYDENDEIPSESYGFTGGEGNYKGDQGTYDGKAKKQAPTTHVKGNGDADFSNAETEYDPEDTEGSEGSYLGDQGDYDGKAKKQAPTSHVKGNGDADFSKAKLNYKTSSGKKDKNYF